MAVCCVPPSMPTSLSRDSPTSPPRPPCRATRGWPTAVSATTPARHFRDVQDLKMALSGDSNRRLYLTIITFLAIMALILGWLCWKAPAL